MSEEKAEKSTWDELVNELGVNVTDDALERRQPPPKELPTRHREKVEENQATPSDWEGLASSLGIDVPPVIEEPPIKKPATSRTEKPVRAKPRTESKPREAEPQEAEPSGENQVETQRVDSSEFVEQTDEPDEDAKESPPITGEAARSAFDALFAADAASWGSAFVSARTNVESSFLFTEGEEAVFTEDISDGSEDEGDEDEKEEKKKSRRRRRRGGRGRGRGGAKSGAGSEGDSKEGADRDEQSESATEESTDADSESSKEGPAVEKRRRRRRSSGRSRSKDEKELSSQDDSRLKQRMASHLGEDEEDDDLEEDLLDEEDNDSPSTGGSRPSHRNLPTWDEAIGVIVDTNLAQRSKSSAKQSSGSSRGRGRGGRRHKKS